MVDMGGKIGGGALSAKPGFALCGANVRLYFSMIRTLRRGVTSVLLLATSVLGSEAVGAKPDLEGSFDPRVRNDTLYVVFRVSTFNLATDSIKIESTKVFPPTDSGTEIGTLVDTSRSTVEVWGTLEVPLNRKPDYSRWSVSAFGRVGDSNVVVSRWQRMRLNDLGIRYPMAFGFGYLDGNFGSGLSQEGIVWSFETGLSYHTDYFRFAFETTPTGNWRKTNETSFSEGIQLRTTVFPYRREFWRPALTLGAYQTTIKLERGDRKFDRRLWGLESGLSVTGPFERFGYAYCTSHGGYHRFDASFYLGRMGPSYLGTRYSILLQDKVVVYRIQVDWEILMIGDGDADTLDRINRRPWWHKALAGSSFVTFVPILAVGGLLYLCGVH